MMRTARISSVLVVCVVLFVACGQENPTAPTGKGSKLPTTASSTELPEEESAGEPAGKEEYILVASWEIEGPDLLPVLLVDIAIDRSGNLYVTDFENSCIHKLAPDGIRITSWGEVGSGDGQFRGIRGITVDASGNVYATDWTIDWEVHRIQKFTSEGSFLRKWEGLGPLDVAADKSGNVYVLEGVRRGGFIQDYCIQKFTADGVFLKKWSNEELEDAESIAVDSSENVYVADRRSGIWKFTSEGLFLTKWKAKPNYHPECIAVDGSGDVYVAMVSEWQEYCVQKFSPKGTLLTEWKIERPYGIAVDSSKNVYVADTDHILKKFSAR